jgi:4-aminobutyrate aminotransferase/(S)-3-amino-2-methylpropionate transaminase
MATTTTAIPAPTSIQIKTPIPGPKSQALLARRAAALPGCSGRATDVAVASANGVLIHDLDGNTLLDFAGGIGMMNVGHSSDAILDAMKAQMDKFVHTCQIVTTFEPSIQLAEMLNSMAPGDFPKKTLFANSGSEAVENAVNLAKYYTGRPAVLVFEGAYHGRTTMALSLTSKYNLFKKGFGSMASDVYRLHAPNIYRIPEGMTEEQYLNYCIDRIDEAFISHVDPSALAAILIEPVMGEGGFIPVPTPFLKKLRAVADQHGIVLIFDEIQCGMARTGKLFACEHSGVAPDLMTIAKSLGAGMPISAVTGRAEIMDKPHVGAVGGTYGGSPVVCAAAIESLKILSDPAFLARAVEIGKRMESTMNRWVEKYAFVGDARGLGPMRLIELVKDKRSKTPDPDLTLRIIKDAVSHGIILLRAGLYSNCIRLLPPLVITDAQLDEGMAVLEDAIRRAHEVVN